MKKSLSPFHPHTVPHVCNYSDRKKNKAVRQQQSDRSSGPGPLWQHLTFCCTGFTVSDLNHVKGDATLLRFSWWFSTLKSRTCLYSSTHDNNNLDKRPLTCMWSPIFCKSHQDQVLLNRVLGCRVHQLMIPPVVVVVVVVQNQNQNTLFILFT